jgi:hypothetical protein
VENIPIINQKVYVHHVDMAILQECGNIVGIKIHTAPKIRMERSKISEKNKCPFIQ